MPKIKTHQATAKRFKRTGSGKLVRTQGSARGHLRRNRSKRAKRAGWKMVSVQPQSERKRVRRLAPYL